MIATANIPSLKASTRLVSLRSSMWWAPSSYLLITFLMDFITDCKVLFGVAREEKACSPLEISFPSLALPPAAREREKKCWGHSPKPPVKGR